MGEENQGGDEVKEQAEGPRGQGQDERDGVGTVESTEPGWLRAAEP